MLDTTLLTAAIEWKYLLGYAPLEVVATIAGILAVLLIAREKIIGWPMGLIWAGISAYLAFTSWQLVSDGILYLSYIPIQLYCWFVWYRNGGAGVEAAFIPTWLPRKKQLMLVASALACVGLWAVGISALAVKVAWIPEPSMLYLDSTTTVLNFFSQFMQAKKRMENWVGWAIVNVLGIYIYWVKESPIYSIQYAIFLGLGIYGWWQWQKHRNASAKA